MLLFKTLYSTSFKTIFSLVTSIDNSEFHLFINKLTLVHAGHFIQLTSSVRELFFVTSFQSIFKTISHHFNHAFSDGDHGIGETIFKTPGFSIST